MSRRLLIFVLAIAALIGLVVWLIVGNYQPSRDGLTEEAIALGDMRRYCQAAKLDCTVLRTEERIVPMRGGVSGGHWEFVIRLGKAGPRYVVAVTPGIESQVAPLDSR